MSLTCHFALGISEVYPRMASSLIQFASDDWYSEKSTLPNSSRPLSVTSSCWPVRYLCYQFIYISIIVSVWLIAPTRVKPINLFAYLLFYQYWLNASLFVSYKLLVNPTGSFLKYFPVCSYVFIVCHKLYIV